MTTSKLLETLQNIKDELTILYIQPRYDENVEYECVRKSVLEWKKRTQKKLEHFECLLVAYQKQLEDFQQKIRERIAFLKTIIGPTKPFADSRLEELEEILDAMKP